MGKIIEEYMEAKLHQAYVTRTIEKLWDIAQKYEKLEADYNKRLRTEMMAMLTDLQLDIEKHTMTSGVTNQGTWNECITCCSRIIQQKIDALSQQEVSQTIQDL